MHASYLKSGASEMTVQRPPQAILPTHRVLSACLVMGEPTLEQLLAEPIVLLRIRRTGVTVDQVRDLCRRTRERLTAARPLTALPTPARACGCESSGELPL
jgi:hypothetical protein